MLLILCSSHQKTALHLDAMDGHTKVCQLLIAGEADVNATDGCEITFSNVLPILLCIILMLATHPAACRHGDTPLKYAIDRNHSVVQELLLRAFIFL